MVVGVGIGELAGDHGTRGVIVDDGGGVVHERVEIVCARATGGRSAGEMVVVMVVHGRGWVGEVVLDGGVVVRGGCWGGDGGVDGDGSSGGGGGIRGV